MKKNCLPYNPLYIVVLLVFVMSAYTLIQATLNNDHQSHKDHRLHLDKQLSDVRRHNQTLDEKLSALQDEIHQLSLSLEHTTDMIKEVTERQASLINYREPEQKKHSESPSLIDETVMAERPDTILEEALQTQQDIIDNIAYEYYYNDGSEGENGYLSEILSNEEKDLDWALDKEASVAQAFQTYGQEAENLSVDCGTTLCKVEFSMPTNNQEHLPFLGSPQWQSIQQDIGIVDSVNKRTTYIEDSLGYQFIVTQYFTRQKDIKLPSLPLDGFH